MFTELEKLRKSLPELLTIEEYCELRARSRPSAYNDMKRISGLAVKIGAYGQLTRIVRDVALEEMTKAETPQPWLPQKDRAPANGVRRKKSTRGKKKSAPPTKQTAEPRRRWRWANESR
jgi:hypothetical protein